MGRALGQDGPVRVSAVDLDALTRWNGERGGIQLPAHLLAEQVQHDPLSVALLTRAARRQLMTSLDSSGIRYHGGLGDASTGGSRDAIWMLVAVPEPFVDDLPVRAGPPSHHPGTLKLAADLVDALPGRNAGRVREMVVVQRTRTDTHRFDDAVAMAARLHDRQYAPLTRFRPRDTRSSLRSANRMPGALKGAHDA